MPFKSIGERPATEDGELTADVAMLLKLSGDTGRGCCAALVAP
ncbi:hypothetical protein WMF37_00820 [Sorangium sp. So ce291]